MEKKKQKLVVVDGSSYLFRAYHALPALMTASKEPTGALYGVINMLRKLLSEEPFDYFVVVFDTKGKNFRHRLYPEYKANRSAMPEELAVQIDPLYTMIQAMGVPLIALEGQEADDVIGSLAAAATQKGLDTLISTGDKDIAQLVTSQVTLVNTMSNVVLDEKGVLEKFGVHPFQIIDYLALVGDAVDNVPGIPKVGPKTAAKWLQEYTNLDNLIAHKEEVKGKVGEYFRAHLAQLPLAKQLVTIQQTVPLPYPIEALTVKLPDKEKLRALYERFEFKSWLNALEVPRYTMPLADEATEVHKKGTYEILLDKKSLLTWCARIREAKRFAIDTETTSLHVHEAQLVGIAFAVESGAAAYLPLAHQTEKEGTQLDRTWVLSQLQPLLADPTIEKIGQNLKYDKHILAHYGVEIACGVQDTMLASYVLHATRGRHDMDSLAKHYLHYDTIPFEAVAGKGAKQVTFDKVPLKEAASYAAEDADITLRLYDVLSNRLQAEPVLENVYKEIELPLLNVLWKMERTGVAIDSDLLLQQSQSLEKALHLLEEQAFALAGQSFNMSSPKQLQVILFEQLQLPILERTPKGVPSTQESVLQELGAEYELPNVILKHRTLSKLKSTYTDKLPVQCNPKTGRVHTSYNQAVTATGRLSSTDPNLQNIPIRTEEGRKIRQAFIASPGYVLLSADYSQVELRIMAHLSQDEGLIAAFKRDEDIHQFTASEIFNIALEEVTPLMRRRAKAINFGLIYGMSAFGLGKQLELDRQSAQMYMDQYFQRYPGVKAYMDKIKLTAAEQGYVETLCGRRLYLPDITSKNRVRKNAAERAAINAPMQGTAADLIKKAMLLIDDKIKEEKEIKMILQVHDELVFEIKEEKVAVAKGMIQTQMQNALSLKVPLKVDIGVGKNWDEAH